MNDSQYFAQAEATTKLGKTVKARVPLSGMPAGIIGSVVDVKNRRGGWLVGVAWGAPGPPWPLIEWLNRYQYHFYLDEIDLMK